MNIHHLLPIRKAACLLAAASLALASPACIGSVAAVPAAVASQWRLDVRQGSDGSQNFRIDPELRCSGSGQASARGIAALSNQLQAVRKADEPLWIIDLRQESHGFWNGEAVSWHGPNNAANAGKDAPAVEADETARLQAVLGHESHSIPMGTSDTASGMQPFTALVRTATTERQEACRNGYGYVRIAATDMQWPEPQAIDAFLTFYRSLPQNPGWLHFHCQAGHGRTTTFMVLYDILQNPELAPDNLLPQTGVSFEWEKKLSAMFITSPDYGTRLTTFVRIDNDGNVTYREKGYVPEHDITINFTLQPNS